MASMSRRRCHERVMMPMQTRVSPLDLMVESGHLVPERPGAYDIRAFLLRGETFWGHAAEQARAGRQTMTRLRFAQIGTGTWPCRGQAHGDADQRRRRRGRASSNLMHRAGRFSTRRAAPFTG